MGIRVASLLGAMLVLGACVPLVMTAGGIAGSAGVNQALNGVTYKTFASPLAQVRLATIRTLNQMEMAITGDSESENGWHILALAADRTIDIKLEALTPSATRMRVVTDQGNIFFRDSATSTEIVLQTTRQLDRLVAARR